MGRRNFPRNVHRHEQFRTEYVCMPEYPHIHAFKIKSMHLLCINSCALYFATEMLDVSDSDKRMLSKLLRQI